MNRLTVLYDASCGFCVKCATWLAKQPAYVEMEFVRAGSAEARGRFPELVPGDELVVVGDGGELYRGAHAWIMTLWALQQYRELAERLANPVLLPFAKHAFELVSSNRKRISRWLGLASPEEILETLREANPIFCAQVEEENA